MLEVTDSVPPDSWVLVELDAVVPAAEGRSVPGAPQGRRVEAERTFFVDGFRCRIECAPDEWNPIMFRGQIDLKAIQKFISVRNITAPTLQPIVTMAKSPERRDWEFDAPSMFSLEDAGYGRQPADSRYVVRLDASLTSEDGQTLGYTWVDIVSNWHERAFTSFGDGHGVWEADGGTALPFYSRNFKDVTQWAARLSRDQLMPIGEDLARDERGILERAESERQIYSVGNVIHKTVGNERAYLYFGIRQPKCADQGG